MFAVAWLPDTPSRTISFSLGTAAISAVGGIAATRLVAYRGIIWAAWAAMILGWGLMTTLDDQSNTQEKNLLVHYLTRLPSKGGDCCCCHWHPVPGMEKKPCAFKSRSFIFLRYTDPVCIVGSVTEAIGGTVGISIGQAIYSRILKGRINRIPGPTPRPRRSLRVSVRSNICPVNTFDDSCFFDQLLHCCSNSEEGGLCTID